MSPAKPAAPSPGSRPSLGPRPPGPRRRLGGGESEAHPKKGPERFRRCPARRRCPGTKAKYGLHPGFMSTQRAEKRRGSSRPSAAHWSDSPSTPSTPRRTAGRPGARQRRARRPTVAVPFAQRGSNSNEWAKVEADLWIEALRLIVCIGCSRAVLCFSPGFHDCPGRLLFLCSVHR